MAEEEIELLMNQRKKLRGVESSIENSCKKQTNKQTHNITSIKNMHIEYVILRETCEQCSITTKHMKEVEVENNNKKQVENVISIRI